MITGDPRGRCLRLFLFFTEWEGERVNVAYNMDCLEAMRSMPDKCFDLAVVDPPYGGGSSTHTHTHTQAASSADPLISRREDDPASEVGLTATISAARTGGKWATKYQIREGGIFSQDIRHWDVAPPPEYFNELARVSKNQIIWGGNYFALPPTRCFLVWRKLTISENFTMAMAEYAWTSFNDNAKVFECAPQGKPGDQRFHPTQKPVELYTWIFNRYAKPGDKILDTHLGSGSSRIAAYDLDLEFTGYEIDKIYFDLEEERFAAHTAQMDLFHLTQ